MMTQLYQKLNAGFSDFQFSVNSAKLIMFKGGDLVKITIDCIETKEGKAAFSAKVIPGAYLIYPQLKDQLVNIKAEVEKIFQEKGIDLYQLHLAQ